MSAAQVAAAAAAKNEHPVLVSPPVAAKELYEEIERLEAEGNPLQGWYSLLMQQQQLPTSTFASMADLYGRAVKVCAIFTFAHLQDRSLEGLVSGLPCFSA